MGILAALLIRAIQPHNKKIIVGAQSRPSPQLVASINSSNGGIARYGASFMNARSQQDTISAVSNWTTYTQTRMQWSLPSESATRLANADWRVRQSGQPQITAQQLANAANHLIAVKLASMSAAQQQALIQRLTLEVTPKGTYRPNSYDSYTTATQNPDGTITVTISPDAFSARKAIYSQYAPQMVTASANFYPAEAQIVAFSIAAGDVGYDSGLLANIQKKIGDMTGLDMSTRTLFGDNGYLARRPLSIFLDQAGLDQFYSDLGF